MPAKKLSISFASLAFDLEQSDGSTLHAVLLELSGSDRNRYMEFVDKNVQRGPNGEAVGMKSWKKSQTYLLSLCLHKAELDETGRPIEVNDSYKAGELIKNEELASWPDHPLQLLSQSAISLSRLHETKDEAGNE